MTQRRYLVISNEGREKIHFDIISASNQANARLRVNSRRPKIRDATVLTIGELIKIITAMVTKTDEQIMNKFIRNTK